MRKLLLGCILVSLLVTPSFSTKLLIIGPTGANFDLAIQGTQSELDDFAFERLITNSKSSIDSIHARIIEINPDGLILLDNSILKQLDSLSTSKKISEIPKFAMMSLNLKSALANIPNSWGVELEVPAYTLFTQFRKISKNSFTKVGVFYQKSLQGLIDQSRVQLAKELVELVAICVDCDGTANEREVVQKMQQGLRKFMFKDKVEVLWMLADNSTLNNKTLIDFWLKTVKPSKFAVVSPFAEYTSKEVNLSHFSAQVDFMALGSQTGLLIESYFEGQIPRMKTEPPLVVKTYLNLSKSKQTGWELNKNQLQNITHIIE